jgi:hypothetical protein
MAQKAKPMLAWNRRNRMTPKLKCDFCGEPIAVGERADNQGSDFHPECIYRAVAGSIAHHFKHCSCIIPGSTAEDPPFLTKHQSALLAYYHKQGMVFATFGIFERPNDAPESFVTRAFFSCPKITVEPITGYALFSKTLEGARAPLEGLHLCRMHRMDGDPEFLVETWI